MASKITYDDKISLTTSALPRANKCTDDDLNEIKTVVNANADLLDTNTSDIQEVTTKVANNTEIEENTEKIVGLYKGETVYEKLVTGTTSNTAETWKSITTGLNIKNILAYEGNIMADTQRPLPFSSPYQHFWLQILNNDLQVAVDGNTFLNRDFSLIIKYTKNT